MFKRKLYALDYPCYENFNCDDTTQFRNLVLWLEDQKIRHYKIEDRKALREVNSAEWDKAYKQYKDDMACPIKSDKPAETLEWLLAFAVRLEYGDNLEKYKNQTADKVKKSEVNAPRIVSGNPLDNLDFDSPDFKKGVNTLAQLLNVTQHPDHLITLKAVSQVVCKRLSAEALENPQSVVRKVPAISLSSGAPTINVYEALSKENPFAFDEAALGFNISDYVLNQAAKILRLLYIQNIRDLQTCINETIVSVQTVTANPKTDTKLGKVGK